MRPDGHLTNTSMDPRLYRAAVEGDISLLGEVVAEHPELLLHNITTQKNNVLHIAVRSSTHNKEFVKHVIEQCPSILAEPNSNGETPLHIAAKQGILEMLYFLVQCLSNVNVISGKATTELRKMKKMVDEYDLERGGPLRAVPHILEASPLSVYSDLARRTTLHRAIIANSPDSCIWAETFPEMIKEKDEFGWTPLHYASHLGFSHSVRSLLVTDKSCAYEPDNSGMYGHLIATHKGHVAVIREFYEHCPDCFELLESRGRAALHIAAEIGKYEVVMFLLEKTHHQINMQDNSGYTPLLLAYENQNEHILTRLRNHPKVNGSDKLGHQLEALHVANEGKAQILQLPSKENEAGEARKDDISRRLKDKANIHLLVATLIATVSFAAGINMPGGYKGDGPYQGMASLTNKAAFQVFVVSNSLAFCFSAASVAIHFMIIIERRVINRAVLLLCALFLTSVGLIGMVTAFISAMIAVLAASVTLWVASSIVGCCLFLVFYLIIGPPFRNRTASVDVNKLQQAGNGKEKDPFVLLNINEVHVKEDVSSSFCRPFLFELIGALISQTPTFANTKFRKRQLWGVC